MDKIVGIVILGYLIVYCIDRILYLKNGSTAKAECSSKHDARDTANTVTDESQYPFSLNSEEKGVLTTGR